MNNKITISIIICNYNNGKYLKKCISSALSQTFPSIEVICVDDGSTDNSRQIIKKYLKNNRFAFVSHKKNMGLLQTRKDGLNVAKGVYILFVDSDDYLELNACKILAKILKQSNYDIISFNTKVFCKRNASNKDKEELVNFSSYTRNKYKSGMVLRRDFFFDCYKYNKFTWNLWNKIYKRELLKKAYDISINGNFNFGEDMYIFCLILLYCKNMYISKDYIYNYNFGSGMSTNKVDERSIKNFTRKCKKLILLADDIRLYKKYNKSDDQIAVLKLYFKETYIDVLNSLKIPLPNDKNEYINQFNKAIQKVKDISRYC